MHRIQVIGLSRILNPAPNKAGNVIIASFDMEVNGFRFSGCSLVRTVKRGLVVWPPKSIEIGKGVWIIDDTLRHQMMMAARAAYRALGGTDAEWIPSHTVESVSASTDEADDETATEGVQRFLAG